VGLDNIADFVQAFFQIQLGWREWVSLLYSQRLAKLLHGNLSLAVEIDDGDFWLRGSRDGQADNQKQQKAHDFSVTPAAIARFRQIFL